MDAELKKLRKLVKFARKEGISSLKIGEIAFNLELSAKTPSKKSAPKIGSDKSLPEESPVENIPAEQQFTEEQVLFWSVPDAGLEAPSPNEVQ